MDTVNLLGKPISVLVAAAVRLYRDGLEAVIELDVRFKALGAVATPSDAVLAARELRPDVIVIDVALGGGVKIIRALSEISPESRILAFAVEEDVSSILTYAGAGAAGFVSIHATSAELYDAIERTVSGELLCSPRMAADLLRRAAHGAGPREGMVTSFTARELQVLRLLKRGYPNKGIATALCISEATVKNHVHHILGKLHVTTRSEAAAISLAAHEC